MNTHSQPYDSEPERHLRSNTRGRGADDAVEELNFEDKNPPRTGEPLHADELAEQLPFDREHEAGLSGAELPGNDLQHPGITDDDLSPETLLAEEEQYEIRATAPADKQLRAARAGEIGGGYGKDEAELARDH
jgi:hypothetical protein